MNWDYRVVQQQKPKRNQSRDVEHWNGLTVRFCRIVQAVLIAVIITCCNSKKSLFFFSGFFRWRRYRLAGRESVKLQRFCSFQSKMFIINQLKSDWAAAEKTASTGEKVVHKRHISRQLFYATLTQQTEPSTLSLRYSHTIIFLSLAPLCFVSLHAKSIALFAAASATEWPLKLHCVARQESTISITLSNNFEAHVRALLWRTLWSHVVPIA